MGGPEVLPKTADMCWPEQPEGLTTAAKGIQRWTICLFQASKSLEPERELSLTDGGFHSGQN